MPSIESRRLSGLAEINAGHGHNGHAVASANRKAAFFHGYYDAYCYLPLYVFCGDHVLCARMREANHDAAFGCRQEMERIVKQDPCGVAVG